MDWIVEIFKTEKPVIGMCHLKALPGDPGYDKTGGLREVIKAARKDLNALQNGGVDAIMFSNEFSLPYLIKVHTETVASMARIIGELMNEISVPFGVDILWDPVASLDLGVATEAKFVREIFTGVYASDFGLWNTDCGAVIRHQHSIGADNIKLLFNIVPESAKYLSNRDVAEIARSTTFNARPDALCISGLMAGNETDIQILSTVKKTVSEVPVFANTGVTIYNVEQQLSMADGVIVGTHFKFGGIIQNPVDESRVKLFMNKVKSFRNKVKTEK